MLISAFIRKLREEKGISNIEFSKLIGLDVSWVGDLQLYEDELDGLTIPVLRKICEVLGIRPVDMLRIVISDLKELPLSDLIRIRREQKGYTVDEFSDRIGYKRKVIDAIENNESLNEVCINALKRIAVELDLPHEFIFEKL